MNPEVLRVSPHVSARRVALPEHSCEHSPSRGFCIIFIEKDAYSLEGSYDQHSSVQFSCSVMSNSL